MRKNVYRFKVKNRVSLIGGKCSVTHTDKEFAKVASIGTGMITKYDTIMKFGDEELNNITTTTIYGKHLNFENGMIIHNNIKV